MHIRIPWVVLILIIFLGLGYFLFVRNAKPPAPTQNSQTTVPSSEPTVAPTINDSLQAGGNSYLDPKGVYSFLYPNDYRLDMQNLDQHTRIYKIGATQQGQTELYDGVTMVFEAVALNGQSLEQWTDDRIKQTTADGTVEITAPKKAFKQNKYPGFTYNARGLGEATYLILQKDTTAKNAVVITFSVNDPQQKGYQQEVDAILSSLKLL